MGGAVCVRACAALLPSKYKMTGMSVLDVVEGIVIAIEIYPSYEYSL